MKKDMTFSADFARCGYTKVSRQAMQIAFTPGDKCEKEAKVLLCILGFAYFKKGEVSFHFKDYACERGEWITSYMGKTAVALHMALQAARAGAEYALFQHRDERGGGDGTYPFDAERRGGRQDPFQRGRTARSVRCWRKRRLSWRGCR